MLLFLSVIVGLAVVIAFLPEVRQVAAFPLNILAALLALAASGLYTLTDIIEGTRE